MIILIYIKIIDNIILPYQMNFPQMVNGAVLIHCTSTTHGILAHIKELVSWVIDKIFLGFFRYHFYKWIYHFYVLSLSNYGLWITELQGFWVTDYELRVFSKYLLILSTLRMGHLRGPVPVTQGSSPTDCYNFLCWALWEVILDLSITSYGQMIPRAREFRPIFALSGKFFLFQLFRNFFFPNTYLLVRPTYSKKIIPNPKF